MEKIVVMTTDELEALEGRIAQKVVESLQPFFNHTPDEIMTAKEVAIHLNVPVSNIRKKTSLKEIPHFKLGEGKNSPVRYRKSEVDKHFHNYDTPPRDDVHLTFLKGRKTNGKNKRLISTG